MTSSTSYSSIAHRNGAVKVTTESVGVLSREVSQPIYGLTFSENMQFMFGRVDWQPINELLTSVSIIFVVSLGFSFSKNRWLKAILFLASAGSIYAVQLQYIANQFKIVVADMQVIFMHSNEAAKDSYPYSLDVTISFGLSILLVIALIINFLQLYRSFRKQKDTGIVSLNKDLGNWLPSV